MRDQLDHGHPSAIPSSFLNAQYIVYERLGEGGMGQVFRAEHRITGQQVAIKVLRAELTADAVVRQRFVQEARVLSRLDHPAITHLINFIDEDDRLYLVMQYVAGITLETYIQRAGRMKPAVAMAVFHPILDACAYAHQQGVVHRDIKPSNIVLMPNQKLKIMDFGIARVESGAKLTSTGSSLGSPAYMSPEQVTGSKVDLRCDIYALGVMLFEMMTGDIPYKGESGYTVMRAHVEEPVPDPRTIVDVPDAIAAAIRWCMSKEPDLRPASAGELARALPTPADLGSSEAEAWADIRAHLDVGETDGPGRSDLRKDSTKPSFSGASLTSGQDIDKTADWTVGGYNDAESPPHPPPEETVSARPEPSSGTGDSRAEERERITRTMKGDEYPLSSPLPISAPPVPTRRAPIVAIAGAGFILLLLALMFVTMTGRSSSGGNLELSGSGVFPAAGDFELDDLPAASVVDGIEMVLVPPDGTIAPFYVDRTEVTYRQYREFLEKCPVGSPCGPEEQNATLQLGPDELGEVLDHPVANINWLDADAYCRFRGKSLMSAEQWRRLARGDDQRVYPWGGGPTDDQAPAWLAVPRRHGGEAFYRQRKMRSGQLPTIGVNDILYYEDEGPFGVMGLGGNVSEWLADVDAGDDALRLVAGGAWSSYDISREARFDALTSHAADSSSASIGFRCVASPALVVERGRPLKLDTILKEGRVRIGAEEECPPMYWEEKDEKTGKTKTLGFEYALMNRTADALGVKLEVVPIIYPDLPPRLRAGVIDLIISAYTPDVSIRGVDWSDSYLEYGLALVVPRGSSIRSVKDLTGKVIGHYNDPATAKAVARLAPGARKILKYEQRYFEDLRDGKLDAFLYDFPFLQAELPPFADSLEIVQFGLTNATYNIGVPEGEWSLMRRVNEMIHAWRSSEDYAEQIRTYLGGAPTIEDIPPGARTTIVGPGETLKSVAARELGHASRWRELWEINRSRLGNENLVRPGMVLLLPDL